jgi:hypothetical protein
MRSRSNTCRRASHRAWWFHRLMREPREHARRLPSHRAWPCLPQTMQTSTCRVRAATAHQVVQIQLDCKHRMSRGRYASSSRPFTRLLQQQCQRLQPRVAGRSRVCLTQKMAFRAVVLGCQRRATACQQARGAGIERVLIRKWQVTEVDTSPDADAIMAYNEVFQSPLRSTQRRAIRALFTSCPSPDHLVEELPA